MSSSWLLSDFGWLIVDNLVAFFKQKVGWCVWWSDGRGRFVGGGGNWALDSLISDSLRRTLLDKSVG